MPIVENQTLNSIGKDTHFRELTIPLAPTATHTVCASGCDFSSIQAAIDAASNDDIIDLASETYTETITIDKSIELIGEGAENTILQAAGEPDIASSRVITVTEEISVTIQGITVRFGVSDYGGGINNHGVLTVSDSHIISNTAAIDGGGLYNDGKTLFHSVLTVTNSTISGNNAFGGGGIYNLAGVLNLEDLIIANNAASNSAVISGGGGIQNLDGEIYLSGLTITDNSAINGGGIFNHALEQSATIRIIHSTISSNYALNGGGIHNYGEGDIAQSVITQSLFTTNTVHYPVGFGGGIYNTSAPGGIGKLRVLESVFSGNSGSFYGGGIAGGLNAYNYDQTGMLELDVSNTLFSYNNAITGGGIAAVSEGDNPGLATVSIHNCTFSGNQAEIGGGAIFLFSNDMTVDKSTFGGNTVSQGGGGAIFTASTGKGNPTFLNISNSTFSNNTSSLYDGGGAILNQSMGLDETNGVSLINVDSSTFADNNTDQQGASIANYSEGISSTAILTLTNTILADDALMSSCHNDGGTIIDGGHNLVEDGSCGFPVGGDPMLGPLAYNGGETLTHALSPSSPAIDAIPLGECSLATDQRGVARPQGEGCDIGAYETRPISLSKLIDNPMPVPGEAIIFTIRVGNATTQALSGGLISDSLPTGLNFIGPILLTAPLSGTVGSAPPVLVTDLTIPPDQIITVTFPVSISYGLAAGTQLLNTAAFSSSEVTIPVQRSITLTVQNAAPIATADLGYGFSTNKDTAFTTASVLINDTDPNGDYLFVESFETSGTLGTVTYLGNGTFDYHPDGQFDHLVHGQQATDIFTYTISDGHGGTDTTTVTIAITGLQDDFYIYLPLAVR